MGWVIIRWTFVDAMADASLLALRFDPTMSTNALEGLKPAREEEYKYRVLLGVGCFVENSLTFI